MIPSKPYPITIQQVPGNQVPVEVFSWDGPFGQKFYDIGMMACDRLPVILVTANICTISGYKGLVMSIALTALGCDLQSSVEEVLICGRTAENIPTRYGINNSGVLVGGAANVSFGIRDGLTIKDFTVNVL